MAKPFPGYYLTRNNLQLFWTYHLQLFISVLARTRNQHVSRNKNAKHELSSLRYGSNHQLPLRQQAKNGQKTSPDYFTASFTKQYCYTRGTSYSTQGRRSGTCDYSQQEQRQKANRRKWFYWLSWKTESSEEEIKHRSAKKELLSSYSAGFVLCWIWNEHKMAAIQPPISSEKHAEY